MTTIDALGIRKRLGRQDWAAPTQFGPDGWRFMRKDRTAGIILTASPAPDQPDDSPDWMHASISGIDRMPTYDELQHMHRAVWPNGYAYQVFAPPSAHVNIHQYVLHLWGRADGKIQLPDFGIHGTI